MNSIGRRLRSRYLRACDCDVAAFKPGNVSAASPGHGMHAADFRLSARLSAAAMADPSLSLGERILGAVTATRAGVGRNTNLGILLLCAPIAQALLTRQRLPLCQALPAVLGDAGRADTALVYRAIRLADPGGLGRSDRHDVAGEPGVDLTEAMGHAAHRDLIARQYANGYADLFGDLLPHLRGALGGMSEEAALGELYLYLLASHPDSHVVRKHGGAAARALMRESRGLYARHSAGGAEARMELAAFDARLKSSGINPGTSADLCVATLFLSRLVDDQSALKPGEIRETPRHPRPSPAVAPHSTTHRQLQGDIQWR